MDREDANLQQAAHAPAPPENLSRPINIQHLQAACKRVRSIGMTQPNRLPRRLVVPQRETSKSSDASASPSADTKKTLDEVSLGQRVRDPIAQTKNMMSLVAGNQDDASLTPPSITESEHVPLVDGPKKVQFALGNNTRSQEMEWDVSNQVEASTASIQDVKHQNSQNLEVDASLRSNGGISSFLAKRTTGVQDQVNPFRNFVPTDFSHYVTQSSVVGSSCATTTLVNSTSAPMVNSTTYSTRHQTSSFHAGDNFDVNNQPMAQIGVENASQSSSKCASRMLADQTAIASEIPVTAAGTHSDKRYELSKDQQSKEAADCDISKDPSPLADKSTKLETFLGDVTDIQSQAPILNEQSSDVKPVSSKSEKKEKPASTKTSSAPRKRNYDPDLFFKVNGKLYQRLGKIGSGGSSEVHKVISQDCTIYALKKIKLKGRDYATAFGFCQEIEYLNKLRGKNHIIQLIDYEVTDKALFKEVMSGSMSNKDGRVKEDGYIYMVLEYGEIDLAHMLSQKWKELDSSKSTIDENWLRFYWQQILLAVNTIHEERIVHSDLKPANFLLVRGSLKLIDFGIAKAIMSDTTNIQRDSQVGTLSYMSPEAFMCNETDANGNTIKCGRPSDIWSLGCILYQMVYGRTPFAEHNTFWTKFKVITDPNYEITYEPLSNLWLLDLMKKCLAWDRHERWRIPQLLQHPFLVPPIPPQLSTTPHDQSCKLFQLVAECCTEDPKAAILCSQLQQILTDPIPETTFEVSVSLDQRRKLLYQMSKLCLQLQERLANSERD